MIDITEITDAELDALLSGTFASDDVETDAGAVALAAAAEHYGAHFVAQDILRAAPSRPIADDRRAARNAAAAGRHPDYEGRILRAQDRGEEVSDAA